MMGDPNREPESSTVESAGGHERLWSPWRMRYVGGDKVESGCIFCNRLAAHDDRQSLILHRGDAAFIIMNLYPYNTGHAMLVPNQHAASPEDADPAGMAAMARLRGPLLRASRRVLTCDGFNLGLNVGVVAGAGVADHLHEHVVPRWHGDANFMPILANTMVMPELIPVTYAKLRAELARELAGTCEAQCVLLAAGSTLVLLDANGDLPLVQIPDGQAVWRYAVNAMRRLTDTDVTVTGWAGTRPAGDSEIVLELQIDSADARPPSAPPGWTWAPVPDNVVGSPGPFTGS